MNYKKSFRYMNADFNGDFEPKLALARDWLKDWQNKHNNLFVCGTPGCGKTYLAMSFLNELAKNAPKYPSYAGNPEWWDLEGVEYITASALFDVIKQNFNPKNDWAEETVVKITRTKLLILDELGLGYGTDSESIELTKILDYRWKEGLPTVFLTNLSMSGVGKYLKDRAKDRAMDGADYVEIKSTTRRNKAKEIG